MEKAKMTKSRQTTQDFEKAHELVEKDFRGCEDTDAGKEA